MTNANILQRNQGVLRRYGTLGTVAETGSTGGNLTLSLPSGWAADMLAIAMVSYRNTPEFSSPSGWQTIYQNANGSNTTANSTTSRGAIFISARRLVGGDGNPTFTRTGGNVARGAIVCYIPGDGLILDNTSITASGWDATAAGTAITLNGQSARSREIMLCVAAGARNQSCSSWSVNGQTVTEFLDSPTSTGADCGIAAGDYTGGGEASSNGSVTYGSSAWHKSATLLIADRVS